MKSNAITACIIILFNYFKNVFSWINVPIKAEWSLWILCLPLNKKPSSATCLTSSTKKTPKNQKVKLHQRCFWHVSVSLHQSACLLQPCKLVAFAETWWITLFMHGCFALIFCPLCIHGSLFWIYSTIEMLCMHFTHVLKNCITIIIGMNKTHFHTAIVTAILFCLSRLCNFEMSITVHMYMT